MQHEIFTKLRIKPSTFLWGIAILAGLVFAYPNIKANQSAISIEREDNTKRESKASTLERELEFEERQAGNRSQVLFRYSEK